MTAWVTNYCTRCGSAFSVTTDERWKRFCLACYIDKKRLEEARAPALKATPVAESTALRCELQAKETELEYYRTLVTAERARSTSFMTALELEKDRSASLAALLEGERMLNRSLSEAAKDRVFDTEVLRRMRLLCHPDKHAGSSVATEISMILNRVLEKAA